MQQAMRQTCSTSPGRSGGRDPLLGAWARPGAAARALVALAVAVSGLVVTGDARAQAQEPGPEIEAVYPTAIAGVEDVLFDVTVGSAPEADSVVPVTVSAGILSETEQVVPVVIVAGTTTTRLPLSTQDLIQGATTGDVTATIGDGDSNDNTVGDPSTATVRVYVGGPAVAAKVGFSAPAYTLDESAGTTTDQIRLTVRTDPGTPVPRDLTVPVWTRGGTATSGDDYAELSGTATFLPPWTTEETPDGAVHSAGVSVPVSIVDDGTFEGDERFTVWVGSPTESPESVSPVSTGPAPECDPDGCGSYVTITDNDAAPESVVVKLVHVPDGTVIADDSTVGVGATVADGTTFPEDGRVFFRLLLEAGDGGPAPGGADVELSFEWTHRSPIVPTSGEVSRIVLSLYRVDVWDSAVQILDNDIGNPDSTLTARITGCWRNNCIIGEPSEITVTIADDDGGPAAAPPGPPAAPRLVCASAGTGYDPAGIDASWQTPDFAGGAPINGYDVQYQQRITGGERWVWGQWQAWPHTGTATSTTITGLDADSFYAVRVRAVNANGPGQWSHGSTFGTGEPDHICEIIDRLTP